MLHLAFEAPLFGDALERLRGGRRAVAVTPRFASWAEALIPRLVDRPSVEAAIELVMLAYRMRLVNDTRRRAE